MDPLFCSGGAKIQAETPEEPSALCCSSPALPTVCSAAFFGCLSAFLKSFRGRWWKGPRLFHLQTPLVPGMSLQCLWKQKLCVVPLLLKHFPVLELAELECDFPPKPVFLLSGSYKNILSSFSTPFLPLCSCPLTTSWTSPVLLPISGLPKVPSTPSKPCPAWRTRPPRTRGEAGEQLPEVFHHLF